MRGFLSLLFQIKRIKSCVQLVNHRLPAQRGMGRLNRLVQRQPGQIAPLPTCPLPELIKRLFTLGADLEDLLAVL